MEYCISGVKHIWYSALEFFGYPDIVPSVYYKSPRGETVIGCRKQGTERGSWHGAYVAVKGEDGVVTSAFFNDNKDYIGHPAWWQAVDIYNKLTEGPSDKLEALTSVPWRTMSLEDITQTGGVQLLGWDGATANPEGKEKVE